MATTLSVVSECWIFSVNRLGTISIMRIFRSWFWALKLQFALYGFCRQFAMKYYGKDFQWGAVFVSKKETLGSLAFECQGNGAA
jgi:hypothetical protein